MSTIANGTFSALDPDDVDALINANGGSGEFEEATAPEPGERWLFPRFKGAEDVGTCSNNGDVPEGHEGIHARTEECGEDFAPDPGNMYLSRTGIGDNDTDVETLVSWLAAPRNLVGGILLVGEPGSGKTALIEAAINHADREMVTVLCTPDHTKDSLFLRFVGEEHGDALPSGERSPYTLGPIPYAAKHGHTLYLDEYFMLIDGVKPITYSLMDGRHYLPEGNVDGSPLLIHPNFRIILSSNPLVRGASLPEPVGSRCASTTLTVETSGSMLADLGIAEEVISAWETLGMRNLWRPQIREMRLADYWLNQPEGAAQAVSAFMGEHCPESERIEIHSVVVSFLGGNIRNDGRLVVS